MPTMPQMPPVWINAILLVVLLLFLYFFLLRPDRKAKREKERVQQQLKPGDKVTTRAGIHGTVTAVNGDLVLMVTGKSNTELEILRSAVQGMEGAKREGKHIREIPLNREE